MVRNSAQKDMAQESQRDTLKFPLLILFPKGHQYLMLKKFKIQKENFINTPT